MTFKEKNISSTVADWSREAPGGFWDPPKKFLKAFRSYSHSFQLPPVIRTICRYLAVIRFRFWSVVCGCDIPLNAKLGGGLILQHPTGVVIHNDVNIGVNCLILQQVTIVKGVTIKGHVDIGAGAKIVKPVTIGEHVKIGANCVVVDDVPPYATVVGIPGKVVGIREPCIE